MCAAAGARVVWWQQIGVISYFDAMIHKIGTYLFDCCNFDFTNIFAFY